MRSSTVLVRRSSPMEELRMRKAKSAPTSLSGVCRREFEVWPGQKMEYHIFLPPSCDVARPVPFIISIPGGGQQHVNGFSHRLVSNHWAVVVPLRPDGAPLMFEGSGVSQDGVSYLHRFCLHLLGAFNVESRRFLMVGVSNGGNAAFRFATLWPELCRGIIAVTGTVPGSNATILKRMRGLPITMYVGTNDEYGFFQPMVELDANLRAVGHIPLPDLNVIEGAGHACSALIDNNVIHNKVRLMFLYSSPSQVSVQLGPFGPHPDSLAHASILDAFAKALGLSCLRSAQGVLIVEVAKRPPTMVDVMPDRAQAKPNSKNSIRLSPALGYHVVLAPTVPPRVDDTRHNASFVSFSITSASETEDQLSAEPTNSSSLSMPRRQESLVAQPVFQESMGTRSLKAPPATLAREGPKHFDTISSLSLCLMGVDMLR